MNMPNSYDVIIIGAGPSGMFAALELVKSQPSLRIAMLEKGAIRKPGDWKSIISGWGGAGAFSDGKLTLSPLVGGHLLDFMPADAFEESLMTLP